MTSDGVEPADGPARTVTGNFVGLAAGGVISSAIGFVATVYIARNLGVESYGVVGFAAAVTLYLSAITDGGLEFQGPREIAEDHDRVQHMAPSILMARLIVASALALVVALLGTLAIPDPEGPVLAVYGLTLFAVAANTRWIHIGLERVRVVAVSRIVDQVIKVLLVFALIRGPADAVLVPFAEFVGSALAALLLILALRRRGFSLPLRFDAAVVWAAFERSRPLMYATLLGLAIYNSDLILLSFFRDWEQVGYYLAGFALVSLLGLLGVTCRLTLVPTLTRLSSTADQQRELYHTAMARVFALGCPIAVGGYLLAPKMIALVFGPAYVASGVVLQIVIWSVPLLLIRSVLQAVLVASGRAERVFRMTALAAGLSVFVNLIAISRYGMLGAAFTTVLTEGARLFLAQRYAQQECFPFTKVARFTRAALAAAVMGVMLLTIAPVSLWSSLALGVFGYVLTLSLLGGIRFRRDGFPTLNV